MQNETQTAYPLQWPAGWPKTELGKRENGQFRGTLGGALASLKDEVRMMGGKELLLSSNYTLGNESPKDPGVVAYFVYGEQRVAIPCDRWMKIEHNVRAIALTIEAMRGMERWGAKHMIKAMFSGFKLLRAPGLNCWEVLKISPEASMDEIKLRWRELSKERHPDYGGSDVVMAELNVAYEEAIRGKV